MLSVMKFIAPAQWPRSSPPQQPNRRRRACKADGEALQGRAARRGPCINGVVSGAPVGGVAPVRGHLKQVQQAVKQVSEKRARHRAVLLEHSRRQGQDRVASSSTRRSRLIAGAGGEGEGGSLEGKVELPPGQQLRVVLCPRVTASGRSRSRSRGSSRLRPLTWRRWRACRDTAPALAPPCRPRRRPHSHKKGSLASSHAVSRSVEHLVEASGQTTRHTCRARLDHAAHQDVEAALRSPHVQRLQDAAQLHDLEVDPADAPAPRHDGLEVGGLMERLVRHHRHTARRPARPPARRCRRVRRAARSDSMRSPAPRQERSSVTASAAVKPAFASSRKRAPGTRSATARSAALSFSRSCPTFTLNVRKPRALHSSANATIRSIGRMGRVTSETSRRGSWIAGSRRTRGGALDRATASRRATVQPRPRHRSPIERASDERREAFDRGRGERAFQERRRDAAERPVHVGRRLVG